MKLNKILPKLEFHQTRKKPNDVRELLLNSFGEVRLENPSVINENEVVINYADSFRQLFELRSAGFFES